MITVPPHKVWKVTGYFEMEVRAETEEDAKRATADLQVIDGDVEVSNVRAVEKHYGCGDC